jgi:hypothetical protein
MTLSFEDHEKLLKAKRAARKSARLVNEVLEANPHSPPDPPTPYDPFAGLVLLKDLTSLSAWSDDFVSGSVGSITQTSDGIKFVSPPAGRDEQKRCEIQFHGNQPIPEEYGYEWDLHLPGGYIYGNDSDRSVNIAQFHANIPCYTGGIRLDGGDRYRLGTRIKGGHTRSWSGSCDQEYDERFAFPYQVPKDRWVKIQVRALWHESNGHFTVWADGEQVFSIRDVPTSGLHDQEPNPATAQKFRLGFYGKNMPHGGHMIVNNAKVYRAPSGV